MKAFLILPASLLLFIVTSGIAQVTPFNSWRALIVYTNSTNSIYGGDGVNMYGDYFAALFDGINQVYEDSEISTRAQIAGVIWDKAYTELHEEQWGSMGGCGNKDDLKNKTNGMGRYVDLMDRYAADVIVLVHQNSPGGCAFQFHEAKTVGYGGFWTKLPNDVYT